MFSKVLFSFRKIYEDGSALQDCQPGLDSLIHVDPTQSKQKAAEVYKCYSAKLLRYAGFNPWTKGM
jgi:hypothetical protein